MTTLEESIKQVEVASNAADLILKRNEELLEENNHLCNVIDGYVFTPNGDYTRKAQEIGNKFEFAIEQIFRMYPEVSRKELELLAIISAQMVACEIGIEKKSQK